MAGGHLVRGRRREGRLSGMPPGSDMTKLLCLGHIEPTLTRPAGTAEPRELEQATEGVGHDE